MEGHVLQFQVGQPRVPAFAVARFGLDEARLAGLHPFLHELRNEPGPRVDDAMVMIVLEIAAGGEAFVQQIAAVVGHPAQQDLVRDQRLQRPVRPAEELVAQADPARGQQNAREMAALLVGQIVSLIHASPQGPKPMRMP